MDEVVDLSTGDGMPRTLQIRGHQGLNHEKIFVGLVELLRNLTEDMGNLVLNPNETTPRMEFLPIPEGELGSPILIDD